MKLALLAVNIHKTTEVEEYLHNYIILISELLERAMNDPRIKGWPLMDSPLPLAAIIIVYVYVIKVALPRYMKNRPAYDLKAVIRWYNVFQIITNATLFYGILTSGWLTTISLGCEIPDNTKTDPESLSMLKWMYLTTMFRIVDFVETSFFILRKKDEQASFLHIYHHCVSPVMMWCGLKFVGGGMASFSMLLNNPVHVIMYMYYLIAAEASPKIRSKMNQWKKYLTILQMTQFTVLLIHALQALSPSCPAPWGLHYMYMSNVAIIYYLFYDFFKKAYFKKARKENGVKRETNGKISNGHAEVLDRKNA